MERPRFKQKFKERTAPLVLGLGLFAVGFLGFSPAATSTPHAYAQEPVPITQVRPDLPEHLVGDDCGLIEWEAIMPEPPNSPIVDPYYVFDDIAYVDFDFTAGVPDQEDTAGAGLIPFATVGCVQPHHTIDTSAYLDNASGQIQVVVAADDGVAIHSFELESGENTFSLWLAVQTILANLEPGVQIYPDARLGVYISASSDKNDGYVSIGVDSLDLSSVVEPTHTPTAEATVIVTQEPTQAPTATHTPLPTATPSGLMPIPTPFQIDISGCYRADFYRYSTAGDINAFFVDTNDNGRPDEMSHMYAAYNQQGTATMEGLVSYPNGPWTGIYGQLGCVGNVFANNRGVYFRGSDQVDGTTAYSGQYNCDEWGHGWNPILVDTRTGEGYPNQYLWSDLEVSMQQGTVGDSALINVKSLVCPQGEPSMVEPTPEPTAIPVETATPPPPPTPTECPIPPTPDPNITPVPTPDPNIYKHETYLPNVSSANYYCPNDPATSMDLAVSIPQQSPKVIMFGASAPKPPDVYMDLFTSANQ